MNKQEAKKPKCNGCDKCKKDSKTDYVSDIRNHISPSTKVIEK